MMNFYRFLLLLLLLLMFLLPLSTCNVTFAIIVTKWAALSSFLPIFSIFVTTKQIKYQRQTMESLTLALIDVRFFYFCLYCVFYLPPNFGYVAEIENIISYFLYSSMCILVIEFGFSFRFVSFSASCCHCLILPLNGFCARATLSNPK